MTSIWGFIVQSVEVSLMALFLLVLKRIFKDKLSPKWQYGIWILFLITLLIPAGYFGSYMIPYIQVIIEAIKSFVENMLQSSYSSAYIVTYNTLFIPYIKAMPSSITDIVFIIYVMGVYIHLIKYFIDYYKLKSILKKAEHPDIYTIQQISRVAKTYHLKECPIVIIEGLKSAFVFGIIRPILVLPKEEVDDKVILHELLHLKNKDLLQNVIWSILKAIHWCNPFINYVFHIIHNDMETLCDQRVLELLDGEERRDYGKILLSMINDQYPHAFGTTSLSNGAIFIKERIETIARFKKYPKGVFLVSICIGILIMPMIFNNTVSADYISGGQFENEDTFSYHLSTSSAKLVKCKTMAGAIDTYAKGLYTVNDLYLISVMPEELMNENMSEYLKNKPTGMISSGVSYSIGTSAYEVYNIKEISQNRYTAQLLFGNHYEETAQNGQIVYKSETWVIPIEIVKENGWKVKQTGEMIYQNFDRALGEYISSLETTYNQTIQDFHYENEYGVLDINMMTRYFIHDKNTSVNQNDIFNYHSQFSLTPDTSASFVQSDLILKGHYIYHDEYKPYFKIGVATSQLKNLNQTPDYDSFVPKGISSVSTSEGNSAYMDNIHNIKNRTLIIHDKTTKHGDSDFPVNVPSFLGLRIYHDNDDVMDLKLNLKTGEVYD